MEDQIFKLQRSIRISTHTSLKLFVTIAKHINCQKYKLYFRPSTTCTLSHLTCLRLFFGLFALLKKWNNVYEDVAHDGDGDVAHDSDGDVAHDSDGDVAYDGDVCDVFAFWSLALQ